MHANSPLTPLRLTFTAPDKSTRTNDHVSAIELDVGFGIETGLPPDAVDADGMLNGTINLHKAHTAAPVFIFGSRQDGVQIRDLPARAALLVQVDSSVGRYRNAAKAGSMSTSSSRRPSPSEARRAIICMMPK